MADATSNVVPATTQAPAAPVTAAPAPGSPEYDAAMAAKFDATTAAQAAAVAVRPEGLPEKFTSVADLAKSYAELEKKLGSAPAPAAATPAAPAAAAPAVDPAKPATLAIPPADAAATTAAAGFDMATLQAEFAANGALKPETLAALDAKGIPKPMVDAYIAGQQAIAAQFDTAVFTEAGGEAEYGNMVKWAGASLSAEEKTAFNKAVESGDLGQAKLAVAGLKSRFVATHGSTPTLVTGGVPGNDGAFASQAQVTAAMKDPRYKTDPAYRDQVMRKLDNATFYSVTARA